MFDQLWALRRLQRKLMNVNSMQKSTKLWEKIFRTQFRLELELSFCQQTDFVLAGKEAPLFGIIYHTMRSWIVQVSIGSESTAVLLVIDSTKLNCFQSCWNIPCSIFCLQHESFYLGYDKWDFCDLSSALSADRDIIFGCNATIALNNLDWKHSGWISQGDAAIGNHQVSYGIQTQDAV